jgi:hypothetical protein
VPKQKTKNKTSLKKALPCIQEQLLRCKTVCEANAKNAHWILVVVSTFLNCSQIEAAEIPHAGGD